MNADSSNSTVVQVEIVDNAFIAFNLSVEDFFTYYVSAPGSSSAYWVHNSCYDAFRNDPGLLERLNDSLNSTPGLQAAIFDDPKVLTTYKFLDDAGRVDTVKSLDAIDQIHAMRNNDALTNAMGGNRADADALLNDILYAQTTGRPVGDALVNHLKNVEYSIVNYSEVEGWSRVLSDITKAHSSNQIVIRFAVNQMRDLDPGTIKKFDSRFDNTCDTQCRFDAQTTDKPIEYKSIQGELSIDNRRQFMTCLGNTDRVDGLEYVFDESKKSLDEARKTVKRMIEKDVQEVFDGLSDEFLNSIGLGGSINRTEKRRLFVEMVNDVDKPDNKLYSFVKVKR